MSERSLTVPPTPDGLRAEIVGLLVLAETHAPSRGKTWVELALETLLRAELARLPQ